MEILLNTVALKITDILDKNNQCSSLERLQMFYGLQTLIYNIVVTVLILAFACLIGTFNETLLLFTFFGTLRIIAGGYHFDSVLKCIIATTLIMVGGGKFAQLTHISFPLCILACVFVNIVFFSYTPRGTHKNPFSPKYSLLQQKHLKIVSGIFTLIALSSTSMLRTVIILSMTITAVFLFPIWNHKFPEAE